jgi:uncharacterized DUF497 family protein
MTICLEKILEICPVDSKRRRVLEKNGVNFEDIKTVIDWWKIITAPKSCWKVPEKEVISLKAIMEQEQGRSYLYYQEKQKLEAKTSRDDGILCIIQDLDEGKNPLERYVGLYPRAMLY